MNANPNVAVVATLVSERSRAAILTVLLDGRFHPASELAYMAGIKPQTASFHLTKLVDAEVVSVEKQGRHRYYGIRNQEVAQIMETLLSLAPPIEIRSLKQATENTAIRYARTCYDHPAGKFGVLLTNSLVNLGVISEESQSFIVTKKGERFFTDFQIDLEKIKKKRRSFSHKCIDWSERHYHLGGALGSALLERFIELNWIQRMPKSRAVKITFEGKKGFKETFLFDI
ncbi:winged helix-turn-helix domain-containing protein [Bacillus sp. AFS055030]|uniref:ArsR/SmtB family transcription factor n=1 Tax=Bacillus sp. AFS055030 TaxID=2033507 RepID=UPI000BFE0E9F|nr:winged helix-turn-helix domain-containing protein [Bacillus sp. AFS055030]PGL67923.1 transcriptional regulator [Bacillus sp. AFS055030]